MDIMQLDTTLLCPPLTGIHNLKKSEKISDVLEFIDSKTPLLLSLGFAKAKGNSKENKKTRKGK